MDRGGVFCAECAGEDGVADTRHRHGLFEEGVGKVADEDGIEARCLLRTTVRAADERGIERNDIEKRAQTELAE